MGHSLHGLGLGCGAMADVGLQRSTSPLFYGWILAGCAFLLMTLAYGVWYSFSVFFVALVREFGWSRAETAGAFSLFVTMHGAAGVLVGDLVDRLGPKMIVASGGVLLAAALAASSGITALWQLYLLFGVAVAFGVGSIGYVPLVTLLQRWFQVRLGLATGIAMAGVGCGLLVVVPAVQVLVEAIGWRGAFGALAALVMVVPPLALLVLRESPEAVGQRPDGAPLGARVAQVNDDQRVVDREWAGQAWPLRWAARTSRFWLMLAAFGAMYFTIQMVLVHQVALLTDAGYSALFAASTTGLIGGVSIFGKMAWGFLSDRIGRESVYTLGAGCMLVGLLLLALADRVVAPWFVVVYGVVFGFGYAVSAIIVPTMTADVFGGRSFGAIFGAMTLGLGLGSAGGAWFAGLVFDLTGSYLMALALAAGVCVLSIHAVWLIAPRRVRLAPGRVPRGVSPPSEPAEGAQGRELA